MKMGKFLGLFLAAWMLLGGAAAAENTASGSAAKRQVLAVSTLKQILSGIMGSNESAALGRNIDSLMQASEGMQANAWRKAAEKLIDDFVSGEQSRALLKDALGKIRNGQADQVDFRAITKQVTVDALKHRITRELDPGDAAAINRAIDAYLERGVAGVADSLENELNDLIAKHVKGKEAQEALKTAVKNARDGKFDQIDVTQIGTELAVGALNDWIDRQNWSDDQKRRAKEVVANTARDGLDGLTNTGMDIIEEKIAEVVGEEQAGKFRTEMEHFFAGEKVDWGTVQDTVGSIARQELIDAIDKQWEKLTEKFPFLKELGISGEGIFNTAVNVWGVLTGNGSLKEKLAALANITVDLLNKLVAALKDYLVGQIQAILNQIGEIAARMIKQLIEFVKEMCDMVMDYIKKLKEFCDKLKETLSQVREDIIEVGEGLQQGIKTIREMKRVLTQ